MHIIILSSVLLCVFKIHFCYENVNVLFEKLNENVTKYNGIAADIAWESSIHPGNPELPHKAASYQRERISWQQRTCSKLATLQDHQLLNSTQRRQTYLLCRGPIYTFNEARKTSTLYEELQSAYSDAEICIPIEREILKNNLTEVEDAILNYLTSLKSLLKMEHNFSITFAVRIATNGPVEGDVLCLNGETDFDKLMEFSKNEEVLRWLWLVWRERLGTTMKEPYRKLVEIENVAARRNGYTDIGQSWRDELEIPNLRMICRQLYENIKPLYILLHGVVRFFLRRHYGEVIPERGPIPAHLLGNLWAANWEPLTEFIAPKALNLDESIRKLNWTVMHMVKRAEDFYQSMGLPAMTDNFWQKSVFDREKHGAVRCHGTAADMYKDGDYRLLYCSGKSIKDFYVLHHEIGHIEYYMAYKEQPGIFRQGANTAFHESIGDAIMYGVMVPQHLHRLGLVNDLVLYSSSNHDDVNEDMKGIENETEIIENVQNIDLEYLNYRFSTDDIFLLKQALNKIPQIPLALLIDEYRWKYFEEHAEDADISNRDISKYNINPSNKEFWEMSLRLQGIAPPEERGEDYFDVGAIFHVPDNTPFIRYFLSGFLQHQLFEKLCKAAVFGRRDINDPLPSTIAMNRCDIYGSKTAGKLLKDLMSRGNSQHWQEILHETIGQDNISASALIRYYQPLYELLERLVRLYEIPIGW